MAELKTKKNEQSVEEFLNSIENEQKRKDSFVILELMKEITGEEASFWGDSIIGFGHAHLKYASGKELDWFRVGFSPRKQTITIYTMNNFKGLEEILERIGKYKTGKSCLYINKLADIDTQVLGEFIQYSYENPPEIQ